VDITEEDLLRYTNSGGKFGFSVFICDLAAALGALKMLVFRNPYLVKQARPVHQQCKHPLTNLAGDRQGQVWLELRGLPLIDVDKFLSFIDLDQVEEGDSQVKPVVSHFNQCLSLFNRSASTSPPRSPASRASPRHPKPVP